MTDTNGSRLVYRHRWPVRVMHWINVVCLFVLLGSGLQIFNAHPSLYWGIRSDPGKEVLKIGAAQQSDGQLRGITTVGNHAFDTTGVLGASRVGTDVQPRAFPSWATIPGPGWLAMGRRWHFFFAWLFVVNGLCYIAWSLASRHLRDDLVPTWRDWRGMGRSIVDHLRFRHPHGDEELRYNVLQRIAYLVTIVVFGGGIVLMGLAMSPRMDAVLSPLVDLVGGRQSARTIHFVIACGFVAFIVVHVLEVIITGPLNQLRGMITGYYRVKPEKPQETPHD
ncbi:thiosulfate reductase cytochrome b subunit [Luteibacter rhizovicinus]|uniref:Thiosulfate reductase cytochrome b subunit n=1 Tax=Luteibacter rhizovicinus TaxID=242606 RepID=A0A4R3YV29_9GAMM|nr:cytochrome b/b6 domain-containing protein [Luteibacter rhizovicinus]TCV95658.1 thiosulfate reductase cytochrome b subunit [Luteibacter rhizovicinus]